MQTKHISTEMNSQQYWADNHKLAKARMFALLKKKKEKKKDMEKKENKNKIKWKKKQKTKNNTKTQNTPNQKKKLGGRNSALYGFACFVPTARANVSHCKWLYMFEDATEDLIQLSTSLDLKLNLTHVLISTCT